MKKYSSKKINNKLTINNYYDKNNNKIVGLKMNNIKITKDLFPKNDVSFFKDSYNISVEFHITEKTFNKIFKYLNE